MDKHLRFKSNLIATRNASATLQFLDGKKETRICNSGGSVSISPPEGHIIQNISLCLPFGYYYLRVWGRRCLRPDSTDVPQVIVLSQIRQKVHKM